MSVVDEFQKAGGFIRIDDEFIVCGFNDHIGTFAVSMSLSGDDYQTLVSICKRGLRQMRERVGYSQEIATQ